MPHTCRRRVPGTGVTTAACWLGPGQGALRTARSTGATLPKAIMALRNAGSHRGARGRSW